MTQGHSLYVENKVLEHTDADKKIKWMLEHIYFLDVFVA